MDSRPLVVGINAQVDPDTPGGTETNVLSLIRELAETTTEERFVLLAMGKHMRQLAPFGGGAQTMVQWPFLQVGFLPMSAGWAIVRAWAGRLTPTVDAAYRHWQTVRGAGNPTARSADRVLRAHGITVVHFPYSLHFETTLPFLYEPWDLQHRHYPHFFSAAERAWREHLYRRGCERARFVVTATRWAKRDIVDQYGIPADKVAVVPRGSRRLRGRLAPDARASAWHQHRLPEAYAFYPAMTFPHKNHLRLLQAIARLRDDHDVRLNLVCSGRIYAAHWPTIEAARRELKLEDQVQFLGPVSDDLQATLFESARFVVFPSLFEGLGLPLLEAMAIGVPVVASDATCIPEVVQGDGVLFDGKSVEAMVRALRAAVQRWGPSQIRLPAAPLLSRFCWSRALRTFIALYRAAAGWPLSTGQRRLVAEATEG